MIEPLERNFGIVIAFLLPGFTCLCGVSALNPTVAGWLAAEPTTTPTIGGFLYVLLGSLATGLLVSAVRWAAIDTIHHRTGIVRSHFKFDRLNANMAAYELAVEYNYRYFQFYANMIVSILVFVVCRQWAEGAWNFASNFGCFLLEVILFFTSRDCLKRYYERLSLVLGVRRDA